jgi:hypothetical protein
MPILTDPMREYVLAEDKRGWNRSAYNSRIREYAIQGLDDLALLAERLPEEKLQEIFNEKTLANFFRALLKIEMPAEDHEGWQRIKETPEMLKKRDRLLRICWAVLKQMGDYQFTLRLVPSNWKPWLKKEYVPIDNLKAILYSEQI